jgi:hypothetical protein
MNMARVLGAGLVASIVMGMVEMVFEATAGPGFWSPLVFIAATVLRPLQSVPIPSRSWRCQSRSGSWAI